MEKELEIKNKLIQQNEINVRKTSTCDFENTEKRIEMLMNLQRNNSNNTQINFINNWEIEVIEDLKKSYNEEIYLLLKSCLNVQNIENSDIIIMESESCLENGLNEIKDSPLMKKVMKRLIMEEIRGFCHKIGIKGKA